MKPDDERYWSNQRERIMLDPATINFNTGTCGPPPVSVWNAVTDLRRRLAASPSDFCWRQLPVRLNYARERLARFLRASAENLLLFNNATLALNIVVESLELPAGSEVLTTDHEYGAMRLLLEHVAQRRGWRIKEVSLPFESEIPNDYVTKLAEAMTPQTRMIFFSHVLCTTGVVLPAAEICRLAMESGAFSVIDGAHAPGLTEVNLATMGADFYAANCHKWMLAPLGSAFLYVRSELRDHLKPIVTSWGWNYEPARAHEDSGWGGSHWHRNLEFHGTEDRCAQLVMPEVLDFRASLDDAAARRRQRYLSGYLRMRMRDAGYSSATPADERLSGAITAFHVPTVEPVKARNYIWERFRVEAPFSVAAGRTFWRMSTAFFNTTAEIDRVAELARWIPWTDLG